MAVEPNVETVTVSPKYQVVIPKSIREELKIAPGQVVHAVVVDGRIELIPLKPMSAYRGIARGIDTSVPNDDEDEP